MLRKIILSAAIVNAFTLFAAYPPVADVLERAIVSQGNPARLQSFFRRAEAGGKFTVGVLGGSITEGALCNDPEQRYSGIVLNYLKKRFPQSEFTLVNAGIGATSSDYGVLRLNRDLLSKKPDLAILEYAVNDGVSHYHAETYEGIIRQILSRPGEPALILLFMMRKDGSNAQQHQQETGAYYRLPMISCRDALYPEIAAGKMKWEEFSPDSVHPNPEGHSYTGKLLTAFLEQVPVKTDILPESPFGGRLDKSSVEEGKELIPRSAQGWEFAPAEKRIPAGWLATVPGSTIEFEYAGEMLFLSCYHVNGPQGMVEVKIDDLPPRKVDSFFNQTWGGRVHTVRIASDLAPGKHKIVIRLLEEKNPASTGHTFRLIGLGGASRK